MWLAFGWLCSVAMATDYTWDGRSSGENPRPGDQPDLWSPPGVPGPGDTAVIEWGTADRGYAIDLGGLDIGEVTIDGQDDGIVGDFAAGTVHWRSGAITSQLTVHDELELVGDHGAVLDGGRVILPADAVMTGSGAKLYAGNGGRVVVHGRVELTDSRFDYSYGTSDAVLEVDGELAGSNVDLGGFWGLDCVGGTVSTAGLALGEAGNGEHVLDGCLLDGTDLDFEDPSGGYTVITLGAPSTIVANDRGVPDLRLGVLTYLEGPGSFDGDGVIAWDGGSIELPVPESYDDPYEVRIDGTITMRIAGDEERTLTTGDLRIGPDAALDVADEAYVVITGGTLVIDGTMTSTATAGLLTYNASGYVDVHGTLDVASGTLEVQDALTTDGDVLVGGLLDLSHGGYAPFLQTGGRTRLDGGTLAAELRSMDNYGAIYSETPYVLTFAGGRVEGDGVLDADVDASGATLAPGGDDPLGTIDVIGGLVLSSGSAIEVELGDPETAACDLVDVAGVATLDGGLAVAVTDDAGRIRGESYTVITYASHDGEFASVDVDGDLETADVATNEGSVVVNAETSGGCSTAPSAALGWLGLLAAGAAKRSRRTS
jgi:hypothetical protein